MTGNINDTIKLTLSLLISKYFLFPMYLKSFFVVYTLLCGARVILYKIDVCARSFYFT